MINMENEVQVRYPVFSSLFEKKLLINDLQKAVQILVKQDSKVLYAEIEECKFNYNDAMYEFASDFIDSWYDSEVSRIENDLSRLKESWGENSLRKAFSTKVNDGQLRDTIYEIAIASILLTTLDVNSLESEVLLNNGSGKNTDCVGAFLGKAVRVEVKRIQDDWPPSSKGENIIAYTRNITDPHEIEDHINPEYVITSADTPKDATHRAIPLSTKVWQDIDIKRGQCESEAINIIAICMDVKINAKETIEDALYGAPYVDINPEIGSMNTMRTRSGPFIPRGKAKDPEAFIDPFRIVSGVWYFKLGTYGESYIYNNPNALIPIPDKLLRSLSNIAIKRIENIL